jgi:6-pyruvoyltetrahydropterin/6-carboxytetrahydropterin synthase
MALEPEAAVMYSVAVQREFIAQHYLIGGDFGPENHPHSHAYRVELRLAGNDLDRHGFLADIDAVSAGLDEVLAGVRDKTLNDLPQFQGLNPSIEHLARILCGTLRSRFPDTRLHEVTVTIWESLSVWAAYTETI